MAPPYADPAHAYNAVVTAASANDSLTPHHPLGNGMPGAKDLPHATIALQRWESDGGAVQ